MSETDGDFRLMPLEWHEIFRLNPDMKSGYALMHDKIMAVIAVFEMHEPGHIIITYNPLGSIIPKNEGTFPSIDAAKNRAEEIVRTTLLTPRVLILNG